MKRVDGLLGWQQLRSGSLGRPEVSFPHRNQLWALSGVLSAYILIFKFIFWSIGRSLLIPSSFWLINFFSFP